MNLQRLRADITGLEVFAADGQGVLFDPHDDGLVLLDALPWALLERLQAQALDAEALKVQLQTDFPDDDAAQQAAAVDEALKQLLDLGLVRAA